MTRGERVIAFIELVCIVPEGKLVGQPVKLLPFQKDFILAIYDNPAQTRRAYLSIGRKNGKSTLIACILLVHLVGPEAVLNSQIVSGARSRDQAAIIFKLARMMVELSPKLMNEIRIVPSTKILVGRELNTEYSALAAEGKTAHGKSPVLALLDEVGQVVGPQDDFTDAITTSQGAHEHPLLIAISTQAPTDADLFSVWLDDAKSSGDPKIVCHLHTAEPDCELDDEKEWKRANPSIGIFRSREDVVEQAKQAERMPSQEANFRVLTLNQRVNRNSPAIAPGVWKANGGKVKDWGGAPVYAGLDLSQMADLTALVSMAQVDEEWHVRPKFWLPADTLTEKTRLDKVPYDIWAKEGLLETTPGKSVDYEFIAHALKNFCNEHNVVKIAFDRWRFEYLRPCLLRAGFDDETLEGLFEDFGQGYKSMSPAFQSLETALLNETVRHGNHPVLTMCASNAVVTMDPAGNRKLDKSKAVGRIDGMVALTMAFGVAPSEIEVPATSPWDDPEFSMLAA